MGSGKSTRWTPTSLLRCCDFLKWSDTKTIKNNFQDLSSCWNKRIGVSKKCLKSSCPNIRNSNRCWKTISWSPESSNLCSWTESEFKNVQECSRCSTGKKQAALIVVWWPSLAVPMPIVFLQQLASNMGRRKWLLTCCSRTDTFPTSLFPWKRNVCVMRCDTHKTVRKVSAKPCNKDITCTKRWTACDPAHTCSISEFYSAQFLRGLCSLSEHVIRSLWSSALSVWWA